MNPRQAREHLPHVSLLSYWETAHLLDVSYNAIKQLVKKKRLHPIHSGKTPYLSLEEIRGYLLRSKRFRAKGKRVYCERIVRWAQRVLAEKIETADTPADPLVAILEDIETLPEMERAVEYERFWKSFEAVAKLVASLPLGSSPIAAFRQSRRS